MTPCIEYPNKPGSSGYSQIYKDGKHWTAHRYFYTQAHGPIPSGLLVCHKCDNKLCVNLDHLYLGTHSDNALDAYQRNRRKSRQGELATNVAKLTRAEAIDVKYSTKTSKELEALYNINQSQVSRIRNGKAWKTI